MQKEWSEYQQEIEAVLKQNNQVISLKSLKGHSIIFVVDMLKGFCQEGKMACTTINSIIEPIKKLLQKAVDNKTQIIAFNDAHNDYSPEFKVYPPHCLENSSEAEMVDELQFPEIKIIKKNSTNGFFAFDFKPNLQWDNIIIVGCCTDICVYQLAISCQTWFNQHNKIVNIYVPKTMIATFDSKIHPQKVINQLHLYYLIKNGINIVKDIN